LHHILDPLDAATRARWSDRDRLLLAKGLRAFADGFVSLLLPLYLLQLGFTPFQVGIIATTTLLGSGLLTLLAGAQAGRYAWRTLLLAACALMAGTGLALASVTGFWPLMLVAFVGTINPSGGDVSVFLPLEHALLSTSVDPRRRTAAFARYSLVGTLSGAFGALCAGLPALAAPSLGIGLHAALQAMFVLYALIAGAAALVYRGLPRTRQAATDEARSVLGPSRRRVLVLAALFSVDAFGGGFLVQSLLALWLYQRFGLSIEAAGFAVLLDRRAGGLLVPGGRAHRRPDRAGAHHGLHAPAVQPLPAGDALLRRAVVGDRAAAGAQRAVADGRADAQFVRHGHRHPRGAPGRGERHLGAAQPGRPAASPAIAGWLLGLSSFGWPLIVGGALKIGYDLLLLAMFARVRPPEEGGGRLSRNLVRTMCAAFLMLTRQAIHGRECIERAGRAAGGDLQYVRVDHRRADVAVTQQFLHRADVRAALQQMGGEAVAQGVRGDLLVDAGVGRMRASGNGPGVLRTGGGASRRRCVERP
jgi:MFS family permease